MKKYFTKTLVLSLLVTIFAMAGSFCFHGLLGSNFEVLEAHAATLENTKDSCTDMPVETKKPVRTSHENSLLPCCVSDTQPTSTSSVLQMSEVIKILPNIVFHNYEVTQTILKSAVYHTPLISPPELSALESTVLRV